MMINKTNWPQRNIKFVLLILTLLSVNAFASINLATKKELSFAVVFVEEPPFIYHNQTDTYRGVIPDIMQALGNELSLTLDYIPTPRKGLEDQITSGRADVSWLSPDWVSDETKVVFSKSLFEHNEYLYSLLEFDKNAGIEEWVKGKTICIRQDYRYPVLEPFFEAGIAAPIGVSSQVPLMKLLLGNRCDLLYMNEHRAMWMHRDVGGTQPIHRSKVPLQTTPMALMFSLSWKDAMPDVNKAIGKLEQSGKITNILQKHLQQNRLTE